jgi:phage terminase large subunit GpA-like protein
MGSSANIIEVFRRGLRPDLLRSYVEWAEKYFILPPGSAVPGLINLKLTPYLIEPLQNFSWTSPIRQEFFMKGIQLGISTLYDIIICGVVDYFPCPLIFYHGSDSMALEYVKIRLEPCFHNNPKLVGKIRDSFDHRGKSTLGLKIFQGGSLKFCGGISEKVYRSYSAAIALMDDIDSFPRDIGGTEKRKGQGSPIDLAKTRTNARQGKYKLGVSGSPTDSATSLIYENFKKTSQRYYHVPCPYCGLLQVIDFWRFRWEKDKNGTLKGVPHLECVSCNKLIPETKKYWMMQTENGAKWVSTKEAIDELIAGRHLSSAYSLLGYSWDSMVKEFLYASKQQKLGNLAPLRTFYNTKLGLPWDDVRREKRINHSDLYRKRENWRKVPENGIVITAGVDVQVNRIEVLVVAFGVEGHLYVLEYKIIGGDTLIAYGLEGSPFNLLEKYLEKTFVNSWEKGQPILHTCIDLGFRSIIVSPFLAAMSETALEITGVFGSSSKKRKSFVGDPAVNKYGVTQREINVNDGKTLNNHKLKNGLIHFNKHPSFTEDLFRQLTVETWSEKKQSWICADHAKNEATDCLNYATAAFSIYSDNGNIDFEDFRNWNKSGCCVEEENFETNIISEGILI